MIKIILSSFFLANISLLLAQTHSLENDAIKRTFSTKNGTLKTISIENKKANILVTPENAPEFSLRISEGTHTSGTDKILTAKDFTVIGHSSYPINNGQGYKFALKNEEHKLNLSLCFEIGNNDDFMRKYLIIDAAKKLCIERIDIDQLSLKDVYQPYQTRQINSRGGWRPGLGQPLFTKDSAIYLGTEFPAADNYVSNSTFSCGYQFGHTLEAGQKITTYSAVLGVADDARFTSDAFYDYINKIRVRPLRLQTQYNSWFDYGYTINEEQFLASVKKVNQELCLERGTPPLKAYVIDDGWQDSVKRPERYTPQIPKTDWSKSVWNLNKKFSPNFSDSFQTVKEAKSSLGLWLSPGCNFGGRCAVPHMREKGWGGLNNYMSLAYSPYMDLLEKRMVELTVEGVTYFKLDGLFGHLNTRDYDLQKDALKRKVPIMPQLIPSDLLSDDKKLNDSKYDEAKIYYLTVGTERLISIFDKMSQANPDVYIVISNGAWLSPWWLMHIDAVWMINAGDAAGGANRTGELVYRDSKYFDIYKKENTHFPMCALFNHEPKKKSNNETKDSFRKYLYMNMSRGTGFIELYLKTFNLKEYDWDVLAEGLLWAEDVFPTFYRSRMHGGSPKKNEVYGYTAWNKNRGYVSIHNPSQKEQTYRFQLDRPFGLIPSNKTYQLSSPLSDSLNNLNKAYNYGDTLTITMQPAEIRILNFDLNAKDWSKLKELQTRTLDDYSPPPKKSKKLKKK
ncbi:hypothetical protein [Rubritalea tangerina]|uniref:Alpha-galactosidase n=1 Tax=Rubritalea tangerina TaxID=430798 RepID=A0ABW4Z9B2_9BACT